MTLYLELYSHEGCRESGRLSPILTDFPVCEFDSLQLSIQGIEADYWNRGNVKEENVHGQYSYKFEILWEHIQLHFSLVGFVALSFFSPLSIGNVLKNSRLPSVLGQWSLTFIHAAVCIWKLKVLSVSWWLENLIQI